MSESFALINCKPLKPNDKWDVIVLKFGKKVIIGREVGCDITIKSIEISRKHALIDSEDNNWFITDLQSTNGLYINDKQLIAFTPYLLKRGDRVSFGPSVQAKVVFEFVDDYCERKGKTCKRKVCQQIDNQLVAKRLRSDWQQLFDSELSCAICHELFISAVNLNCSHTFCLSCIEQWKSSNTCKLSTNNEEMVPNCKPSDTHCCPVCRQPIVSQNRVLALDNVIEYMVLKSSPKLLEQRRRLIEERKQMKVL